ncbi:uncharacterized protein LOC125215691 isoform X2 [Salvia hispanica]|uniref:uncharacterized protein LOC125215691 isoform X2 n=1 Tax=Salvia hispanica TaxID=49212 RepID=UPI0020095C58|nr:uncharacterized protein LOC125215691 isoform X2 [Salvia hispanica]
MASSTTTPATAQSSERLNRFQLDLRIFRQSLNRLVSEQRSSNLLELSSSAHFEIGTTIERGRRLWLCCGFARIWALLFQIQALKVLYRKRFQGVLALRTIRNGSTSEALNAQRFEDLKI